MPDNFVLKYEIPDLKRYTGRSVKVRDDDHREHVVEIQHLVGSLAYPTKLQINGRFLISALDFFGQMNGEKIPQEQIDLFEKTVFDIKPRMQTGGSRLVLPSGGYPRLVKPRGSRRR